MKQIIRANGIPIALIDSEHSMTGAWHDFKVQYKVPVGYPAQYDPKINLSYQLMEQDGLQGVDLTDTFLSWIEKKYGPVERFYVVDLV